jgi:hypothetical protein
VIFSYSGGVGADSCWLFAVYVWCAKQAKETYQYHNIKRKLYKTTAAIWYNKACRDRQLTPKYISIRVNGNNKQSQKTLQNATRFHINQEIKFLYIKKQKLNQQLYYAHLKCAETWSNNWQIIQPITDNKLQQEMEAQYHNLNKKLHNIQSKHKEDTKTQDNPTGPQFYHRTVNLTRIEFTKEEINLLNHGLQHSIEKPLKSTGPT